MANLLTLPIAFALLLGLLAAAPAGAATPQQVADELIANDAAMRQSIDAWRGGEETASAVPPDALMAQAEFLQATVRLFAKHPNFAEATLGLLPPAQARDVRALTTAARKLRLLSKGSRKRKLKTGPPPPLAELAGHYAEAERASGIDPSYMAAIHHVETKFGRVKSRSVAGARGPMQFIPSTWRIYGRGGDIDDPHDAILAAGRLLRANGAPRNYGRALFAYNNSRLYVAAVTLYAKLIRRDPYALHYLYCWGA
jgi:membrane-bound lytic murein transglycosylase B